MSITAKDVNSVAEIETKLTQLEEISFENCPVLDIMENPAPVEGTVNFVN